MIEDNYHDSIEMYNKKYNIKDNIEYLNESDDDEDHYDFCVMGKYVKYDSIEHKMPYCKKSTQNFFKDKKGNFVLKKFDDINKSTETMLIVLKNKLGNFDTLYFFLRCEHMGKMSNNKYSIKAVRWENFNKGESIGWFKHSLGILIRSFDYKVKTNIKLTGKKKLSGDDYEDAHKIQITGIKNTEEIIEISQFIINELIDARDFFDYVRNNKDEFLDASLWITKYCLGDKIEFKKNVIKSKNSSLRFIKTITKTQINWSLVNNAPDNIKKAVLRIYNTCCDIEYVNEFEKRIDCMIFLSLTRKNKPCDSNIAVNYHKRCMTNTSYHIGIPVNQQTLFAHFISQGFDGQFFNGLTQPITINMINDKKDKKAVRREEGYENKFLISSNGIIRHSGTGGKCMENCYLKIMLSIISYIIEENLEDQIQVI